MKTYHCYIAKNRPFPWKFFFQFSRVSNIRKSYSAIF